MNVLDLFSGIGGFSLGLERAGMRTIAFCETDEYCRKVLGKHWPSIPIYGDIRELTGGRLESDGIVPDLICGGFPCQDISIAGKQAGIDGERSGLWAEFARIIGEVRPRFALVENVPNLLSGPSEARGRWFGRILGDLAEIGYDTEWHCIPASHVGAPHRRDRVWILAHHDSDGQHIGGEGQERHERPPQLTTKPLRQPRLRAGRAANVANAPNNRVGRWQQQSQGSKSTGNVADTDDGSLQGQRSSWLEILVARHLQRQLESCRNGTGQPWAIEPNVGRVAHGVPARVDRLRVLGNAVVPQVVEMIGRAIMEADAGMFAEVV